MDFGLSEEQRLLQHTLREFAGRECPPPRLREAFESGAGPDAGLWKGLAALGIAGLALPERYGGAGLEVLDLALVSEVLGEAALPVPFLGHVLAGLAIAWGGSEAQQQAWLPQLATGDLVATVAFGEEGDLWQPEEWQVREAGGRLTGHKRFVPDAGGAGLLVVGVRGGGLALVEPGRRGIHVEPVDGIDRTRPVGAVDLDDARGERLARGSAISGRVRDAALALLAADALGAGWRLLRDTIAYVGSREQFGTPLAQFQAVKHQIADGATELEPARGLLWYAAHAVDRLPERAPHAAAAAKAHITDRALDVARDAVELHGGVGYTWESDVQIFFKRVLFDRAFLGTPAVHRERSAALAGW